MYFCIDICGGGGVYKAMAAYLHTVGITGKYSRKKASFSEKNDVNVPKAHGGTCKCLLDTYSHLLCTVVLHSYTKAWRSTLTIS